MDLRHLRAFAAVAELRSFSSAARRMHVAQPPLSRYIRQLENEIGVTLFVRTTTGVQLSRSCSSFCNRRAKCFHQKAARRQRAGPAGAGHYR